MSGTVSCRNSLLPLVFILLASVSPVHSHEEFHRIDKKIGSHTKHFEESLFKVTERGQFSVELLIEGTLKKGRNDFEIVLHDADDRDVEGAAITMRIKFQEQEIDVSPAIRGTIPGLYEVEGLAIDRTGPFAVVIAITKGGSTDRVTFSFP